MNKKMSKRNFDKFSKRNTHKRKSKERAKSELLSMLNEISVGTDALKIKSTTDRGRRGRVSNKAGQDEIHASGIFSSSKSGFGFVRVDGLERDVFIPEGKCKSAIDGDTVDIVYHTFKTRFGEEKTEGRVTKITAYSRKTVIGTVENYEGIHSGKKQSRRLVLVPDNSKIQMIFDITNPGGVKEGDKVEAVIKRNSSARIECEIIKNFGNTYTKSANYEAILSELEIETEFSKEELCEAEFFASLPLSDEGRVRRDNEIIFTIDGESAKDLDDAISLKRLKGGKWQLGVHIADVSSYVKERGHLDRAVMRRGTSIYFTDKVVPMLPKVLSNGVCSLNAGEEKYALSAIINLSELGEILSTKIEKSIIKSRVRGVYSEVNRIFEGTAEREILSKYKEVIPTLKKMHELYLILKKKSEKRGAFELDSAEAEIILSDDGEPVDIVKRTRGDAERLIEQFMLCANEAVATFLFEREIPCVYRVHDNPPKEKLDSFVLYMQNLGFDTRGISGEKPEAKDFSELLLKAEERGISGPVSYSLLRSMAKAKYSENKSSHFGLAIANYCHFTSPIRRLSDLATHRIIHRTLFEGKRPELYSGYARRAAAAATEGELRAISAERRIENLYKVIFMEKHIGESFPAIINSVSSFGFFAELENTCEGLVPISSLPGVFTYDEKNRSIRSRQMTYRLGDTVTVRLVCADRISGKLQFELV